MQIYLETIDTCQNQPPPTTVSCTATTPASRSLAGELYVPTSTERRRRPSRFILNFGSENRNEGERTTVRGRLEEGGVGVVFASARGKNKRGWEGRGE